MPAAVQVKVEAILGAAARSLRHDRNAPIGSPAICYHRPTDRVFDTVGTATGVEIRIADERDQGRGEVLVRGNSVTAASKAVDSDVNARTFSDG